MPKQRFGLGRGLDALIPAGANLPGVSPIADAIALDTSLAPSAIFEVPVETIAPNPLQPRMPAADDEELLELAASIQEYGLLQPLLVTLADVDGETPAYTLIAGERRWRAARIAGIERVPVVIRDATPQLMLEMALVENLQRTDLNPLEAAEGYRMLIEEYQLTQDQVAERVGRKRSTIANTIRLLQLPPEVREALVKLPKAFTEGQASYETRALEEEFTRSIELKVRLQRNAKGKGSLTLYFTNEEQLQAIYDRIVLHGIPADQPIMSGSNGSGNGSLGYGLGESSESLLDDAFDISFDGGGERGSDN